MNVGLVTNTYSSITNGKSAMESARTNAEDTKFSDLVNSIIAENKDRSTVSSEQIIEDGRFNGDYTSGFSKTYSNPNDKSVLPTGAAANQANSHVQPTKIDKTSKLYEKSMELESFFVKQMLSSMRKTVLKTQDNNFAQDMYEDMLYDEYATAMTKNAGFGLADQIYLSLMQ